MKQFTVENKEYLAVSVPDGNSVDYHLVNSVSPNYIHWEHNDGSDMERLPEGDWRIIGQVKDLKYSDVRDKCFGDNAQIVIVEHDLQGTDLILQKLIQ